MTFRNILIFIIIIYIIISLVMFVTDFWFYFIERYSRFHIGRWDSYDKWVESIKNIAIRWSKKTPTVKIRDNNKFIVIDMIKGRYRSETIQSWQKGGILLGLLECNDDKSKNAIKVLIDSLITKDGMWRKKPVAVDCGLLSYAILKSRESR